MRPVVKSFLLPALGLLAGCGFQPIYGSHDDLGPVSEQLNQVAIERIPDRAGQERTARGQRS
jgi:hypothetical protein